MVWFLWLFVAHDLRFPVGPDAPVYLWWMRAAGHSGLSVVGQRPGTPAFMLAVAGALHLSPVSATAGIEVAAGVAVGLASCAFARACEGVSRAAWVLGGVLAGTFAVHLVAGYLSNLLFAVAFLGACAALCDERRRGTLAAAVLLGAGGLAHPQFFVPGAAILLLVAGWALLIRSDESEFARIAWAVGCGACLVVLALASMVLGPAVLPVDTSRDGFMRRAGLRDLVRAAYADRFVHRWTRYVQWLSLPLAAAGSLRVGGTGRRILRAWLVVIVAGIPVGLLTGLFPADRLITFGYAVPILAGFGTVWLYRRLGSTRAGPRLAAAACAGLVATMSAGSLIAWNRQAPFVTGAQVTQLQVLNRYVAGTPADATIVVRVDSGDETATFAATQAANLIRASVPPDRIADVHVEVATDQTSGLPDEERRLLSEVTAREARQAIADANGRVLFARLDVFFPFDLIKGPPSADGLAVAPGVRIDVQGFEAQPAPEPIDPLEPSSPWGIVGASAMVLAMVWVVGYGWARTVTDRTAAVALAPAFGAAAVTLVAVVAERAGLPLDGWVGPTLVSALAGGGGYFCRLRLGTQGQTVAEPPPEIEQ
ncbi:MAG: hypothetical protein ABJC60_09265 [Actinomycetota bacterium]